MDAVLVPKLMGSEVFVKDRVCAGGEARDSDAVSTFSSPKVDDFNSQISHRGFSNSSESSSWIQKVDTESCRRNPFLSRLATEDVSQGLDHGIASSSIASMSASDGRQTQRKVGKVPRNGSGSFKKLRMLQTENSLPQPEANDTKMEPDKLGMPLFKCSNTDKSATAKQKSINGRRGDRRNYKVQMKGRYDPFSLKAGLPSCSPTSGGSNTFVMYGLKPDIHDVTKLIDDISLDELLDGSYNHPTQGKDKGKRATNVNENILDSVRKACSVLRLQGLQQGKQSEDVDINAKKKTSLVSSPSNTGAANSSDGDESSVTACLSKCSEDQESCIKAETPADMNDRPLYQPKDILERLLLPPPKDLDSLLQDAVKPAIPGKLTESRSGKQLSHCVTLPPFSWSSNFNGHYKSNNDATRTANKSTCLGRWVRIRSAATFIGSRGNEDCLDLKSLAYDDSLVPAGRVKYRLPEIGKTLSTSVSHDCCQQDLSSVACSTATLPPHESGGFSDSNMNASHSPTVLAAAETLCDIASHCTKHNGIMRWPKQPSQKAMKARKSRSSEKTDDEVLAPASETILNNVARHVDYGSSKKPKISVVERREEVSHVQAVIGLSSVSAPRSSRSSPIRLSREAFAEARHCNKTFTKPPFMVPPPPRVLDRSNNHPQKLRKVGSTDWNKTRS